MSVRCGPDDPNYRKAFEVLVQLQDWVEGHDGLSATLTVGLVVTRTCFQLNVGEITVWDTENFDTESLTFEACRKAFVAEARNYAILCD